MKKSMYNQIGVIGDVHLEYERLQLAFNHIIKNNVDHVFCTGDIVNYTSSTKDDFELAQICINFIRTNNISTVLGNHDDWYKMNDIVKPDEFQYLKELPMKIELRVNSDKILFCHGIGNNYMAKVNPDDSGYAIESNFELLEAKRKYSYLINGHSHRKMIRKFGNLIVINAGTLQQIEDPGFVIIDFHESKVMFFEFDNNNSIFEKESISFISLS